MSVSVSERVLSIPGIKLINISSLDCGVVAIVALTTDSIAGALWHPFVIHVIRCHFEFRMIIISYKSTIR